MSKVYEQIRKAVGASNKSRYELWHDAKIDQGQMCRFMYGTSGLSIESMERLLEALGLEIIVQPKRTKTRKASRGKKSR